MGILGEGAGVGQEWEERKRANRKVRYGEVLVVRLSRDFRRGREGCGGIGVVWQEASVVRVAFSSRRCFFLMSSCISLTDLVNLLMITRE